MLARKLGISADYLETGSEIRDTDERELQIADAELELRLAEITDEAEAKLKRLRSDAMEAGDAVVASRANIALGLAAAHGGRNGEAIEMLESGLELAPVSASMRPDVFATLGKAYAASGRPKRAVELFEHCLAEVALEAPDDFAAQVKFTTYLSYGLTDLGGLRRAEEVLEEALGKADGADSAFREATILLEAHGHRRAYVDVYRSWGKFLRRAGREEEALEVLERATDLAAEQVAGAQAQQAEQ